MAKNDEVLLVLRFFMTGKINAPSEQMYTLTNTRETQLSSGFNRHSAIKFRGRSNIVLLPQLCFSF